MRQMEVEWVYSQKRSEKNTPPHNKMSNRRKKKRPYANLIKSKLLLLKVQSFMLAFRWI